MPGGESGHEFLERYEAAIARVATAGHRCALVVSHGAAIRAWTAIRGVNVPRAFIENPLHNTGIVIVEGLPDGEWTVASFMGEAVGGDAVDSSQGGPTGDGVAGGFEAEAASLGSWLPRQPRRMEDEAVRPPR